MVVGNIPVPERIVDRDAEVKEFAQKWLLAAIQHCHTKHEAEVFLDDCVVVLNNLRSHIIADLFYNSCPYDRIIKFPVGFLQLYLGKVAPDGWFICDGSSFDPVKFPKLSALLIEVGLDGEHIPDMRECVPVGAGQNETLSIVNHDVYEVGQFKDDQLMSHKHDITDPGHSHSTLFISSNEEGGAPGKVASGDAEEDRWSLNTDIVRTNITVNPAGTGTVTRTKQFGVNYIIKGD